MPVQHESTTPAETAACRSSAAPCPACRKRAGAIVDAGTIHGYGSEPRGGWTPRRLPDETASPTFGVELELQRAAGRDRLALTGEEAVAVTGPRGHWFAQSDASVSGPELASQPGSLGYWRSIRPSVAAMFRGLIHGGMRSHDGPQSCSAHVNVGADAFGDADHLARFLRLVTVNPRWTTRLAQRTHEQMSAWAHFRQYPDNAACVALAREYMSRGYAYTDHSAVVNLGNAGRVEFRAPRGTLRVDRFYAKVEWVAAMVEWTRDAARSARPTPGAFTQWAVASGDYPEFAGLVADLMPGRVAPRPVATASGRTDCRSHSSEYPYRPCTRTPGHFGQHEHADTGERWVA